MYGRGNFSPGDLVWFDPGVGYVLPGEVLEFHQAAQVGGEKDSNFFPGISPYSRGKCQVLFGMQFGDGDTAEARASIWTLRSSGRGEKILFCPRGRKKCQWQNSRVALLLSVANVVQRWKVSFCNTT